MSRRHNRHRNPRAPRASSARWLRLLPLVAILLTMVWTTSADAKNIFDDDWTPPPPARPAEPPAPAPATPRAPTSAPGSTSPGKPRIPSPVPVPVPVPASSDHGPVAATRRPIPSRVEQARSRKLFKEVFARELADRSVAARHTLSVKLLEQATKTLDVPSDHFVLLMGASDAARDAADLPTCFSAIDDASSQFALDPLSTKVEAVLTMTARPATPAASLRNSQAGLEVISALIDREEYLPAARVIAALTPGAAGDPATSQQYHALARQTDVLRTASAAIQKDREKLQSAPSDPSANLAVGQFYCFAKGDWARGLPMLAKGWEPKLKALASADLANPTQPADQADLADKWWDLAAAEPVALTRRFERQRAAYWYEAAAPGLTALRKELAEQRLTEFEHTDAPELVSLKPATVYTIAAGTQWIPVEFNVIEGRCYHITARGDWTTSADVDCDANGACPDESLSLLGPQPGMSNEQKHAWYLGQHPAGALLARIGDDDVGIFAGKEVTFIAPASGKLSFRINDGDSPSAKRSGKLEVTVTDVQPHWLDAHGSAVILARIDDVDMLHVTPEGVYWEWGGHWSKVGEHDGHFPTIINGIFWWPNWTSRTRSAVLKTSTLRLTGRLRLVRVLAKRGEVTLQQDNPTDAVLRFKDNGLGSSEVGCVVSFSK